MLIFKTLVRVGSLFRSLGHTFACFGNASSSLILDDCLPVVWAAKYKTIGTKQGTEWNYWKKCLIKKKGVKITVLLPKTQFWKLNFTVYIFRVNKTETPPTHLGGQWTRVIKLIFLSSVYFFFLNVVHIFKSYRFLLSCKPTIAGPHLWSLSQGSFGWIRHARFNHDDENNSATGFREPWFTIVWEQTHDALANREPRSFSSFAKRAKLSSSFTTGMILARSGRWRNGNWRNGNWRNGTLPERLMHPIDSSRWRD